MSDSDQSKSIYNRVIVKLSGETLTSSGQFGIDPAQLDRIAKEIDEVTKLGVEIGIVLGGGNLFRGKALADAGLGRVTGDHMGMLATVMNALALRDALERIEVPSRIMSSIQMTGVVDPYDRRKAIKHLRNRRVVIFAAGTGNPFFTTDSAACLRAIEVDADIVLKATKVDGVYSADPMTNPDAKKFDKLTYDDILHNYLQVMDHTAICLCRDYNMPLKVFNMKTAGTLQAVLLGEPIGTLIGSLND